MSLTQFGTVECDVLHVKGKADALSFTGRSDAFSYGLSLPRGQLAYAQITTSQSSIGSGSLVALTGLSVTVNVPANRILKVTGYAVLEEGTSASSGFLYIKEDGAIVQYAGTTVLDETLTPIAQRMPAAGSHTYALFVEFSTNANNVVQGQTDQPAFILVEDIGGTG